MSNRCGGRHLRRPRLACRLRASSAGASALLRPVRRSCNGMDWLRSLVRQGLDVLSSEDLGLCVFSTIGLRLRSLARMRIGLRATRHAAHMQVDPPMAILVHRADHPCIAQRHAQFRVRQRLWLLSTGRRCIFAWTCCREQFGSYAAATFRSVDKSHGACHSWVTISNAPTKPYIDARRDLLSK